MKAAIIKGVKNFETIEVAEPVSENGRVIVKVKKAGICGSDIHMWDGGNEGIIPGHEFCGVVTDPGSREDLKEGDRVIALSISPCGKCEACLAGKPQCCKDTWTYGPGLSPAYPGGYEEKTSLRPDLVKKLPDNVSFDEGAMVEPLSVSLHGARLANIKKGDKVLVMGGGIIGLGAAMFGKMEGAGFVAVFQPNPHRAAKAISLGVADKTYDAKDPNFVANAMADAPEGFDSVIDCVGLAPAINAGIMLIKNGHNFVMVGVATAPQPILNVLPVIREIAMLGSAGYNFEEFDEVIKLCETKAIDATKFIDDVIAVEDVQDAFERLTSGSGDLVKIVIDPEK